MIGKHLVFYDGTCGLCDHVVQFLLPRDRQEVFLFAPLQGKTAEKWLSPDLKKGDALVLIENFSSARARMYSAGKAVFRILWLLGGAWALLGLFFFLPAFFYDWGYRLVASHRHLFFADSCRLPDAASAKRFLP